MRKLLGYKGWTYDPAIHGPNDRWWKWALYRHGIAAAIVVIPLAGIPAAYLLLP